MTVTSAAIRWTDPSPALCFGGRLTLSPFMARLADIIGFLSSIGEVAEPPRAPADVAVTGIASDRDAGPGEMAWLSSKHAQREPTRMSGFRGALLLAPADVTTADSPSAAILRCRRPKLAFTRAVNEFFPKLLESAWPKHGGAPIAADANIASDANLAAGIVIGPEVTIGARVSIGPNTCVAHCRIGANVTIGANCSIGLPGFGYEKDDEGRWWRFPHIGTVVIEDGVEIGSNTCIDRGALGETRIGAGAKIDNLVHIAHNVVVGKNAVVIANSMIGGSAIIGDGVWVAPSVSVMNQVAIGENATLGMGAVVLKPVDANAVMVGNPARPLEKKATS